MAPLSPSTIGHALYILKFIRKTRGRAQTVVGGSGDLDHLTWALPYRDEPHPSPAREDPAPVKIGAITEGRLASADNIAGGD